MIEQRRQIDHTTLATAVEVHHRDEQMAVWTNGPPSSSHPRMAQETCIVRAERRSPGIALERELSPYEIEMAEAMTVRRDAALQLRDALNDDVSGFDGGMATIAAGKAIEILVPPIAGQIRQDLSLAVAEFEAARHRFRLALIALAIDHGMSAPDIGVAFSFSRQLASRYLGEALARWPDLRTPAED